MKIEFLEEAQFELDESIEYYNREEEGLNSLDRIARFPEAWHPLSQNTRRCQTRRFPYGIIYTVIDELVLVISISHLHRKPNHWKNRKK